jgi:hypothetical protein
LLGLPTYVISDEDILEFVCALQSEHLTPEKLFHELEHNHLLIIGSNFSNWLARMFLRMAKRKRLSDPRDVGEVLADDHSEADVRLMKFLQQVSVRTRVYGGAEQFVAELHRRWTLRRTGAQVVPIAGAGPQRFLPPEREMPENAVFISYAREDLAAVQRLKAALDVAGIRTWFDLDRLEGGDDYDRKIQRNIARCSYFIPVVSATTERRLEGYFRREWSYAIDRTRNMAEGSIFILPACIDDTNAAMARVPDRFRALHMTGMPGGDPPGAFVERLKSCSRPRCRRERGYRRGARRAGRTSPAGLNLVDAENPWLGLDSFSEETPRLLPRPRGGDRRARAPRAEEAPAILFGQSGLGKTSILRAGIVPRLRKEATARCTCASTTRASRRRPPSRSSRRSSARPRARGSGPVPAPRSPASRCGNSCTTATTCCATPRARCSRRC